MEIRISRSLERIAKYNPDLAKDILKLREDHACLLRLPMNKVTELQKRALRYLYLFDGAKMLVGQRLDKIIRNGIPEFILVSDYRKYSNTI